MTPDYKVSKVVNCAADAADLKRDLNHGVSSKVYMRNSTPYYLHHDLNRVSQWFPINKLRINFGKDILVEESFHVK